jgi:hypothetical protein
MVDAVTAGARMYGQSVMCVNHPDVRAKAKGLCNNCYARKYLAEHAEYRSKCLARATEWRRANPEKSAEISRRSRGKMCPVKKKDRNLRKKYGITIEQFEQMLADQGGVCFLCNKPPAEGKQLHVDHCHKTHKVRALLCNQCNWYLGKIDADRTLLDRLFCYVELGGIT